MAERTRESNTVFSVGARVVRQYTYRQMDPDGPAITHYSSGVPDELSDRTRTSPVATVGGSIIIVFMAIIFGFLIGLNLVNDKEEGTDNAIKISPVSRVDYFVGKSIFPFLLTIGYVVIALLALRLIHVHILHEPPPVSWRLDHLSGGPNGRQSKRQNRNCQYRRVLWHGTGRDFS